MCINRTSACNIVKSAQHYTVDKNAPPHPTPNMPYSVDMITYVCRADPMYTMQSTAKQKVAAMSDILRFRTNMFVSIVRVFTSNRRAIWQHGQATTGLR